MKLDIFKQKKILNLIKNFLKKYPKVQYKNRSERNFNKRRYPSNSRLDVNKTIKQQFNLLRINDNDFFPHFSFYKRKKYIFKIFKDD